MDRGSYWNRCRKTWWTRRAEFFPASLPFPRNLNASGGERINGNLRPRFERDSAVPGRRSRRGARGGDRQVSFGRRVRGRRFSAALGRGGRHRVQVAWQAGDGAGALALELVWASDYCRRCRAGGSVVVDQAQKKNSLRG